MRGALALLILMGAAPLFAQPQPCPNEVPLLPAFRTWKKDTPLKVNIHSDFDSNPGARGAIEEAIRNWVSAVNAVGDNMTVEFLPAGTPDVVLPGSMGGLTNHMQINRAVQGTQGNLGGSGLGGWRRTALMTISWGVTNLQAMKQVVAHEFGHSKGLDDCAQPRCAAGSSVMTLTPHDNDTSQGSAIPTPCDLDGAIRAVNPGVNTGLPFPGGTSTPVTRPVPPPMVGIGGCHTCYRFVGITLSFNGTDREHIYLVASICCIGRLNLFNQNNLSCESVGYVNLQRFCEPDSVCCAHPDDMPPEWWIRPVGTTCAEQGWWNSWDKAGCEASIGNPNPPACVKKEQCGGAPCSPDYCWKVPYVPGPGPDPDPEPEPDPGHDHQCYGDLRSCESECRGTCERRINCEMGASGTMCFE